MGEGLLMVEHLMFCCRIEFFRGATVRIDDLENIAGSFKVSVARRSDRIETFDAGIMAYECFLVWL
ncbi:hypothetical protein A5699_17155 [Mycobacterium sp. E802]|nr:hypothetical protein A5699_17155 [Mycobacterium sp. E802]